KENITENLEAFVVFSRNSFKRRALNLKSFLLLASLEDSLLNLTVKNLLRSEILFINLSLNSSFNKFEKIEDMEKLNVNFLIPNQNANYILEIFYETPYSSEREEILIKANEKKKLLLFFDIGLESQKLKLRDKVLKEYELA
ncbi:MAG: hypothetical protein NZ942_01090, partial [Candidatus Aenigmarchaeota archaeon]|nr:hypothetical protein [Candidatus Aenigmarchaeota archaeon]